MKGHRCNATKLIVRTFEEKGVDFEVECILDSEQVIVTLPIKCGPDVIERFVSVDDDNDISVVVSGLLNNTPKEKHNRLLEAVNLLNNKYRFVKFTLDGDGDIRVEYDFPSETPTSGVGMMAFEMLFRTKRILDEGYSIIMKAMYSDELLEESIEQLPAQMICKLEELRTLIESDDNETDNLNDEDFFIFNDEDDGPNNEKNS